MECWVIGAAESPVNPDTEPRASASGVASGFGKTRWLTNDGLDGGFGYRGQELVALIVGVQAVIGKTLA